MLFAHLKRILRLDRLRLRGPSGARDEFLLAATAQNLRKLAKLIAPSRAGHGHLRGEISMSSIQNNLDTRYFNSNSHFFNTIHPNQPLPRGNLNARRVDFVEKPCPLADQAPVALAT